MLCETTVLQHGLLINKGLSGCQPVRFEFVRDDKPAGECIILAPDPDQINPHCFTAGLCEHTSVWLRVKAPRLLGFPQSRLPCLAKLPGSCRLLWRRRQE